MMFGYNAHLLQVAYAKLFAQKTENEIADILSSFDIRRCEAQKTYVAMLKKKFKNRP
jgi:hypothetical protein